MKTQRLAAIGVALLLAAFWGFSAHAAVPAQPTTVSPAGKVAGATLNFLWNPVSGAAKYQLQVKKGSTSMFNRTFTAAQANCSDATGTCSAQVTLGNGAAALTWTLRAGNSEGFGAWSAAKSFVMTDEMRTPISKLPFTVSSSGSFYVAGNLASAGNGIIVNADDVTIDLNGYSLTGSGSGSYDGVYMNGRSNVEIKNGTIKSFGRNGIYEASAASGVGHRVIGVRAVGNGNGGIYLLGLQHLVKDCSCAGNGIGVYTHKGGVVSGNTCSQNSAHGILVDYGCTLIGNTVRENDLHGIFAVQYNTIKNNTATTNGKCGIFLADSYQLLDGNTAYDNNTSGGSYANINDTECPTCQFGLNVK